MHAYAAVAVLVSISCFSAGLMAQPGDALEQTGASEVGMPPEHGSPEPGIGEGATLQQNLPPPPPPRASAASAPRSAPEIALETQAPAAPVPRAIVRVHDGFYLRLAAGFALGTVSVANDRAASPDYALGGGGGVLDVWIGGGVARGLTLGGALTLQGINSDSSRLDGNHSEAGGDVGVGSIAFFVDGFPNPRAGFHLGGALGLASVTADTDSALTGELRGGGVSLASWVGYDWWVGKEWSLGGALRLLGAFARSEDSDLTQQASFGSASLVFTALYN